MDGLTDCSDEPAMIAICAVTQQDRGNQEFDLEYLEEFNGHVFMFLFFRVFVLALVKFVDLVIVFF